MLIHALDFSDPQLLPASENPVRTWSPGGGEWSHCVRSSAFVSGLLPQQTRYVPRTSPFGGGSAGPLQVPSAYVAVVPTCEQGIVLEDPSSHYLYPMLNSLNSPSTLL